MSNQGIIKDITLNLDINARKRVEGKVDIKLYSKDIATGQFEFTFIDEDGETVVLDETYSAQALVKYEDEEKTYLDDMTIEGNIIRFIFPHDFITKDGIVTMYIYITKDNYTSDVAAISFNVYRSEIDDVATDIVAAYDKNYEDILAEFKQTLEDYKSTLPKADSVRADIDEILNQFSEDSQAKLSQYDTDVQQVITDINEAETSRVEAEGQRESAETSRKANEADRDQAESERQTNETKRQTIFETNESERDGTFSTNETVRQENETTRQQAETQRASAESSRVSAEEQRQTDHANRSAEMDGKADKVVIKNLVENGDFSKGTTGWMTAPGYMNEFEIVDNIAINRVISDVNHRSFVYNSLSIPEGNIVYSNFRFKQNNITKATMSILYSLSGVNLVGRYENIGNDFEVYSAVGPYGPSQKFRILIGNIETDGTPEIYLDYLMLIDLTETFGKGNEPTKEEMDELIKVTGYIDEEYALNNKEMLGYLMKGISEKANKKQEDWITPTLLNGTTSGERAPRYRKDEFGVVRLSGSISDVSRNQALFVLPVGYRPDGVLNLPTLHGQYYNRYNDVIRILPNGNVICWVLSNTSDAQNFSLDGISFVAEG